MASPADDTVSSSSSTRGLAFSIDGIVALARSLSAIDLNGLGPPYVPWGNQPSVAAFQKAIDSGAPRLPLAYRSTYVEPLRQNLQSLASITTTDGGVDPAETLLGAIYGHAAERRVVAPLRRFLVLVADLYNAFLADEKRAGLGLPLIEELPPLATFRHNGSLGPYTFPADVVQGLVGARVGVVSLPSAYREHPLSWGSLAHETAGHDVLHADPGLLGELGSRTRTMVYVQLLSWNQPVSTAGLLAELWRHWIDEAAADVYGLLRMGPAFALNLIAWLAALRARLGQAEVPHLLTDSISQGELDDHPIDILRIHLALGVTSALLSLNQASRAAYVSSLSQLAELCAGGAASVRLQGSLPLDGGSMLPVATDLPLPLMQSVAALVGWYIAATPLASLRGKTMQDVETWTDTDESAAFRVATGLGSNADVSSIGDPAHLLAGATFAAISDPESYSAITSRLDRALDFAFENDPLWTPQSRTRLHGG